MRRDFNPRAARARSSSAFGRGSPAARAGLTGRIGGLKVERELGPKQRDRATGIKEFAGYTADRTSGEADRRAQSAGTLLRAWRSHTRARSKMDVNPSRERAIPLNARRKGPSIRVRQRRRHCHVAGDEVVECSRGYRVRASRRGNEGVQRRRRIEDDRVGRNWILEIRAAADHARE